MEKSADSGAAPTQYVFDVREDVPELGLRVGDRVVVTSGAEWPITVLREMPPNYGRVLGLFLDGALDVVEGDAGAATRHLQRWTAVQQGGFRLHLVPAATPPSKGEGEVETAAALPTRGTPRRPQ